MNCSLVIVNPLLDVAKDKTKLLTKYLLLIPNFLENGGIGGWKHPNKGKVTSLIPFGGKREIFLNRG